MDNLSCSSWTQSPVGSFCMGQSSLIPNGDGLLKKKTEGGGGLPLECKLLRDGMKILQWSSNPKLPSKNIPLPPRRDLDVSGGRAEAGGGWADPTRGQAGDRRGQADGRSGQVQLTSLGRPLTWGAALFYHKQEEGSSARWGIILAEQDRDVPQLKKWQFENYDGDMYEDNLPVREIE